jgi:outer membrane protein OmpA-like peptidoglycan-associated protein
LESGFSSLDGTNPLVTDISIIPFAIKFGYELPIYFGFGAQADLHLGYFFSKIIRYPTAVDMLMDNSQEDNEKNLFAGARLYLTWTISGGYLKAYAGGGIDAIIENDGPIPLPLIEAGLSLKPLPIALLFSEINKTERKKVVFGVVFFEPEDVTAKEESLEALNVFGAYAKANPRKKILLRSYAVRPDKQQRLDLSLKRAEFCREYLITRYGIEEKRIKIDPWGSRDTPEAGNENIKFYDCVELIIDAKKIIKKERNTQ